jgi:hypothetical protein
MTSASTEKVDFSKKETQIRNIITKKQPDRKNHQKKGNEQKKQTNKHLDFLKWFMFSCFFLWLLVKQ